MAAKRVLILNDCQIRSIIDTHSWSDFMDDDNEIELYIFTSNVPLSEKDKSSTRIRVYKEIAHPTTDGKPKVGGKPADVTVNVEQSALLKCTFSGFPKPEVTWFKDNVPITPDEHITIHEDKPNMLIH